MEKGKTVMIAHIDHGRTTMAIAELLAHRTRSSIPIVIDHVEEKSIGIPTPEISMAITNTYADIPGKITSRPLYVKKKVKVRKEITNKTPKKKKRR